jgi:hypothetical protein
VPEGERGLASGIDHSQAAYVENAAAVRKEFPSQKPVKQHHKKHCRGYRAGEENIHSTSKLLVLSEKMIQIQWIVGHAPNIRKVVFGALSLAACNPVCDIVTSRIQRSSHMNLVLIILILLLLFGGGGGYYYGGPYMGGGIGTVLLIIIVVYLLMGRRKV